MGPPPDPRFATKLELAWQLQSIERLQRSADWIPTASGASVPFSAQLGKYAVARDASQTRIIQYWREFDAALPKDPTDYMAAFKNLRELDEEYTAGHDHAGHDHEHRTGLSYSLMQYLRPTFSGATTAMARQEARKRLLTAAVDVLEGRPGALPIDPFSGKPLVHKGNLVYSFAENQKDDGGSTKRGQGMSLPLDFIIRLPG
jgi:hypothetical protein